MLAIALMGFKDSITNPELFTSSLQNLFITDEVENGGKGLLPLALVAFTTTFSNKIESLPGGKEFIEKLSLLSQELLNSEMYEHMKDQVKDWAKEEDAPGFGAFGGSDPINKQEEDEIRKANEFMDDLFTQSDSEDEDDEESDLLDFSNLGITSEDLGIRDSPSSDDLKEIQDLLDSLNDDEEEDIDPS